MGQRKNKTFRERYNEVYEFFMDFYFKNRIAPSYTEMVKGTGILRGNLALVIDKLVEDEKLERKDNTSRGLWPANSSLNGSLSIHLKGNIAANNINPLVMLDQLDNDTTLEVPKFLLPIDIPPSNLYALQVKGDSMNDVNILDGDYVVLQSGNQFRDNDIVAIFLKDENAVTLKILGETQRGSSKLQPKSAKHQPRFENPENVQVQGRVVAVMRKC